MNPDIIDPEDVELPAPPACPAWCTEATGHEYTSIIRAGGTGERPWFSRSHQSADLAVIDAGVGGQFTLDISAEEFVTTDAGTCTEPPTIGLGLRNDYQPMTAAAARALAAALSDAADHLDLL